MVSVFFCSRIFVCLLFFEKNIEKNILLNHDKYMVTYGKPLQRKHLSNYYSSF